MSGHHPELVGETEIAWLHDAAEWATTPPDGEDRPHLLNFFYPPDEMPEGLRTAFPEVEGAEIRSYQLTAVGRAISCVHHVERAQPCHNILLHQQLSIGGLQIMYKLRPNRGPDGRITHQATRELKTTVIGRLLFPGEVREHLTAMENGGVYIPRFSETLKAILHLPELPTVREAHALVELLVRENKPDQYARDHPN